VRSNGDVLVHTRRSRTRTLTNASLVIFDILQKRIQGHRWIHEQLRPESFATCYADVKNFSWQALPIWLYRQLIQRYSSVGDVVAHIFSGSGNGGIAALQLGRKPVLIDLHYQAQIQTRFEKKINSNRLRCLLPFEGYVSCTKACCIEHKSG
jgi:hypothetical protein